MSALVGGHTKTGTALRENRIKKKTATKKYRGKEGESWTQALQAAPGVNISRALG